MTITVATTWTLVWIVLNSTGVATSTDHLRGFGNQAVCEQAGQMLKEQVAKQGVIRLITGCIQSEVK